MVKVTKKELRAKYKTFLASPYWANVRAAVIMRDGRRCTKCGITKDLQAHHKTYAHHGSEHLHLGDLVTLCKRCHKQVHKEQRARIKSAKKAVR